MGMNCEVISNFNETDLRRDRVAAGVEFLQKYPNVYREGDGTRGFVVMNSEMAPRYEVGNVAYLDSNLTPQPGDDVLLTPAAGTAITRRLDRETKSSWHVTQFNPKGCSVLKKSHWPMCEVIRQKNYP